MPWWGWILIFLGIGFLGGLIGYVVGVYSIGSRMFRNM